MPKPQLIEYIKQARSSRTGILRWCYLMFLAFIITVVLFLMFLFVHYLIFDFYNDLVKWKKDISWKMIDSKTYISGQCSCPVSPCERQCLYHSRGDDVNKIIDSDRKSDCSRLGCACPTEYKYCD